MVPPFEDAGRDAFAAILDWYGEAIRYEPRRRGDFAAVDDPDRPPVDSVGGEPLKAAIVVTADIERVMGDLPGRKFGANLATAPIVAYVPAEAFAAFPPAEGDRVRRLDRPGTPVIEVARIGDQRAGRVQLFCVQGRDG